MIITDLTPDQLRRAADIQERIQSLQQELTQLLNASGAHSSVEGRKHVRNKRRSAAWKKALSESMKARWAVRKGKQLESLSVSPASKKPASEARLKALEKARAARWAKFRAARK